MYLDDFTIPGYSLSEDYAAWNTKILQQCINNKRNIYLPNKIPINDTLTISKDYNGHTILGGALNMVADNKPIIMFKDNLIEEVTLKNTQLNYKIPN